MIIIFLLLQTYIDHFRRWQIPFFYNTYLKKAAWRSKVSKYGDQSENSDRFAISAGSFRFDWTSIIIGWEKQVSWKTFLTRSSIFSLVCLKWSIFIQQWSARVFDLGGSEKKDTVSWNNNYITSVYQILLQIKFTTTDAITFVNKISLIVNIKLEKWGKYKTKSFLYHKRSFVLS